MNALTGRFARILFGLPFIVFGISHLMNASAIGSYVPSWIPWGTFWAYVTGILFILASIAILTNTHVRRAAQLIAIMLTVFVLVMHLPSALSGGFQAVMVNLLKDIVIIGGALLLAGMPSHTS